ncbi:MAG TPA: PAS domain-containing protein [Ferruginibacter sp.]|nr:PAS domain-containing protein [Ferruginibacter sp.]
MQEIKTASLHLSLLPGFARFIYKDHLNEFVQTLLQFSRELDLPILKYFAHLSEPELVDQSLKNNGEFLRSIVGFTNAEDLDNALTEWKSMQLEFVKKNQIQLDELLLISYVRKRAFCTMIRYFTNEPGEILELVAELDRLFMFINRSTTNMYVQFLKSKIEEDIYFREKLSDTSPGFYYIYDLKHNRQVQQTSKLFTYLGYGTEEFENDTSFFAGRLHPDDHLAAVPYLEKVKSSGDGEVHFFEYRLKSKTGEYKWMRNYESVYKRDHGGDAVELIGIAFDISRERAIRDELIFREEDLLEAQELSNMGSYIWHLGDGSSFKTPQTNKIFGLTDDDSLEAFVKRIHPADKEMVVSAVKNALEGTGEFEVEYRCNVDGTEKIIWGKGKVKFENDKPVSVKGTVMDVTDKHHMVQKLQRSENLYKQAQSLNKLGNWTWEIKTDKLEWSDELYRIFGLEPQSEKLNFERFVSFIHPEDREERIKRLEEQMTHTKLMDYHFQILAADGQEKVLYGQSRVLADDDGVPYKMIGTCQDVTQQKELERSLYQKTIQLERSNANLEDFAFISSHDLKEPLRKVSVYGDKLRQMGKALTVDDKKTLDKMIDAARRMQQMVDELLSLSRITSDHSFQVCSLNKVLNNVLQSMEELSAETGAKIEFDKLPDAYINEVQFHQLFGNLLSNAIKFRKKNAAPVIKISHRRLTKDETITLKLDHQKKYLRIDFTDNGIGINEGASEKIFTIFQRLHGAQFEGTGIGLAICKKIVEHHNGLIFVTSAGNEGSTFSVIIPDIVV